MISIAYECIYTKNTCNVGQELCNILSFSGSSQFFGLTLMGICGRTSDVRTDVSAQGKRDFTGATTRRKHARSEIEMT